MKRHTDVPAVLAGLQPGDPFRRTRIMAAGFLLGAFAVFVLAVVLLPEAIASTLGRIMVSVELRAEPIEGTVLLKGPNDLAWKQLRDPVPIGPGSRVSTDSGARAFFELLDGSTVQIHNNTEVLVEASTKGAFRDEVKQLGFRLLRGRAVFGVAHAFERDQRSFWVNAGKGRLELLEGSYLVEMLPEESVEVLVRSGEATLFKGSDIVKVGMGGRGSYAGELPPIGDLPAMSPLLRDAKLVRPGGASPWRAFVVTEAGINGQVFEMAVESTTGDSRGLDLDFGYRFRRVSEREPINRHGEAGIVQIVDRDIRDYSSLRIRARLKVDDQTLSGGGSAGTEYPVMVKIFYVDVAGQDQIWYHGFYYQNKDGFSVAGASPAPQGAWFVYDDANLMEALVPRPKLIRRFEVLGSGWGFDSWVTEVSLEGR